MKRPDSIREKGLERHINEHCVETLLPWRYKHFVDWVENGNEYGEKVRAESLRKRFGVSRPTILKWLRIYKEEKGEGKSKSGVATKVETELGASQ